MQWVGSGHESNIVVIKKFTLIFFINLPSGPHKHFGKTKHWWMHKFMANFLDVITYEAETLPVHSSVPANNKETIKQILIDVYTLTVF